MKKLLITHLDPLPKERTSVAYLEKEMSKPRSLRSLRSMSATNIVNGSG